MDGIGGSMVCAVCLRKNTMSYSLGVTRSTFERETVDLMSSSDSESDEDIAGLCKTFKVKTPIADGGGFIQGK